MDIPFKQLINRKTLAWLIKKTAQTLEMKRGGHNERDKSLLRYNKKGISPSLKTRLKWINFLKWVSKLYSRRNTKNTKNLVFPGSASGKVPPCQCRRCKVTRVRSLGWEDPLEEVMVTHSSFLAWRIPWTEKPGGQPSKGSQRVRHNWSNVARIHWNTKINKINQ